MGANKIVRFNGHGKVLKTEPTKPGFFSLDQLRIMRGGQTKFGEIINIIIFQDPTRIY